MIEQLKQWLNIACDAFMRGIRAEAPPGTEGKPAGKILVVLRDGILVLIELILTAAAIFTYVLVSSSLVKTLLVFAIIVSGIRTYTVAKQLRDTVFRHINAQK